MSTEFSLLTSFPVAEREATGKSDSSPHHAPLATMDIVQLRAMGHLIEEGFRAKAMAVAQDALAAGIAVSFLTEDGQVAWINPDGTIRLDIAAPTSPE